MRLQAIFNLQRQPSCRRFLLVASLATLYVIQPAKAASFDCMQATTNVEHAICDSKNLSDLDSRLNENYKEAIENLPDDDVIELRKDQRAWLKERNACTQNPAQQETCMENLFRKRSDNLQATANQAALKIDGIIAQIPASPANAAYLLQQYRGPLTSAWLVYLNQFEPTSGVTNAEAQKRHQMAVSALEKKDKFAASLLSDIEKDPKTGRDEAVLTFLRMIIEQAGYNESPSRPYVHCFIFTRQGDAAYQTFGALWGSSRDGQAPICDPQGDLFTQPEWKQLNKSLESVMDVAHQGAGTIRFASYADWAILKLRATASPTEFLKPIPNQSQDDPEKTLREWDAKSWPTEQREQVLAAIDPVRKTTMKWLQTEKHFTEADASKAANAIVRDWLNGQLNFLSENLSTGDE